MCKKEEKDVEYFELLCADGNKLGKIKERNQVHKDGDLHGGSHVWVVRKQNDLHDTKNTSYEVLLQKRRKDKDSFPGCYDVSCAGHMTEGETFLSTALRELKEELNIAAEEENLTFLFSQAVEGKYEFHGQPFWNREVNFVYLLSPDVSLDMLAYQKEEIESLKWKELDELVREIRDGNPEYCICLREMEQIEAYLKKQ